jgi:hypothetical protein
VRKTKRERTTWGAHVFTPNWSLTPVRCAVCGGYEREQCHVILNRTWRSRNKGTPRTATPGGQP